MKHIPITNNTDHPKYFGKFRVAPGETRIIDEAELPPHLQEAPDNVAVPEPTSDPLLDLLDLSIPKLTEKLADLSSDELDQLEQAETDGNTRTGAINAIAEARLVLAAGGGESNDDDPES